MTKWLAEFVGRGLCLGSTCMGPGVYNYSTFSGEDALKFDTKEACEKFIKDLPSQTFISKVSLALLEAREHEFVD